MLVGLFETMPTPAPATTSTDATTTASATSQRRPARPTTGPPAAAGGAAPRTPVAQGEVNVEKKPTDPDVRVRANHVWARIALRPKAEPGSARPPPLPAPPTASAEGNTKSELREARLRGSVVFHEDPAPGKQRGTNVTGEAIDVTNLGENKMYFKVYNVDPDKAAPLDQRAKISPSEFLARIETLGRSYPLARVETEDFTVDGPKIGLNQLTDEAWVDGRGVLTQLAPLGLLSDKGLDNAPAQPAAPTSPRSARPDHAATGPDHTATHPIHAAPGPDRPHHDDPAEDLVDAHSMQFKGQSTNPQGQPVARAHFVANVRAEMEDSLMLCQEMTTYMDRTVKLTRPKGAKPAGPGNGTEAAANPNRSPRSR